MEARKFLWKIRIRDIFKWIFILVVGVLFMLLWELSIVDHYSDDKPFLSYNGVETLSQRREFYPRPLRKILFWPAPWHSPMATGEYKCLQENPCDVKCDVTLDKSEITTVDAVDFNVNELWPDKWVFGTRKTIQFPKYRRPDQVWIVSNNEPPQHQYADFTALNGVFNWTRWYRSDSTVPWYYGEFIHLNNSEKIEAEKNFESKDYHSQKSKDILGLISDCTDSGRRYNLIKKMRKYTSLGIDTFGRCYKPCGWGNVTCHSVIMQYRFFMAFENNHCKDYVTEKYWNALHWEAIPIVNWKRMNKSIVVPNSYININDFESVKVAMDYIEKVSANRTLYKSYFAWKKTYKLDKTCSTCHVCRALNDSERPAQVIRDLAGWHIDDFCGKVTFRSHIKQVLNGWIFQYFGFGL